MSHTSSAYTAFSPLQPPVAHLIGSLETSSMFIETSS